MSKKQELIESWADPKLNWSWTRCKRCKKEIYAPMPCDEQMHSWGVYAFTVLAIAHLYNLGWRVIKKTGEYVCPDCLTDQDTEFMEPVPSALEADKEYCKWIDKMKKKYNL